MCDDCTTRMGIPYVRQRDTDGVHCGTNASHVMHYHVMCCSSQFLGCEPGPKSGLEPGPVARVC